MTQVICLTSVRGRSGKDTLIELLQSQGINVVRVAMGDVLKEQCAADLTSWKIPHDTLLQWFHSDTKDQLLGDLAIKEIPEGPYRAWLMNIKDRDNDGQWMTRPRSPRWHLQQYGTDYRRNHLVNPDVWLEEGIKAIRGHALGGAEVIVVSDMRQRNEYVRLSQLQGTLWTDPTGSAKVEKVHMVRLHRMWFIPGVDDASYHITDLDLIGFSMSAVVLNEWGQPAEMITQLKTQGVLV